MDYYKFFKMPNFGLSEDFRNSSAWFHNYGNSRGRSSGSWSWLGGLGSIFTSLMGNVFNLKQTRETNQLRRELADEQNQLAREESEKGFQRSRPINQVNEMRLAGMSHAGAINALNGGGSYTPAPVASAEQETPQVDLSGMVNAMQAMASLQEQKRQFDEQMKLQREQHKLAKDEQEFQHKRLTTNDAYDNILKTFQGTKLENEANIANLKFIFEDLLFEDRLSTERQELGARKAKALSEDIKNTLTSDALKDIDPQVVQDLFKYQAMLEMIGNIGTMSLEKAIGILHDIKEIFVPG